jgi:hypothetical protein
MLSGCCVGLCSALQVLLVSLLPMRNQFSGRCQLNVPSVHIVAAIVMYAALRMAAVCVIKDCRRLQCTLQHQHVCQ